MKIIVAESNPAQKKNSCFRLNGLARDNKMRIMTMSAASDRGSFYTSR